MPLVRHSQDVGPWDVTWWQCVIMTIRHKIFLLAGILLALFGAAVGVLAFAHGAGAVRGLPARRRGRRTIKPVPKADLSVAHLAASGTLGQCLASR
jgi:hypothetical protein